MECADCGYATYCSAGCRQAGEAAHGDECGVLQAWADAGGGPAQSRGLRLFLRLAYACQRHPATLARLKQLQAGATEVFHLPMDRLDHQGSHLEAERLRQMVRVVSRAGGPTGSHVTRSYTSVAGAGDSCGIGAQPFVETFPRFTLGGEVHRLLWRRLMGSRMSGCVRTRVDRRPR